MSIVSKNKKFVELDGVRIFHDKKSNSISLISTDEDLVGKPFKITLHRGSESEETLRELLRDSGVISREAFFYDPFVSLATLPKFVKRPNFGTEWVKELMPIGVSANSKMELERVELDLSVTPHTLITGKTGLGMSNFIENIMAHFAPNNLWDIHFLAKVSSPNSLDLKKLARVKDRIVAGKSYEKPTMIFIDNIFELLNSGDETYKKECVESLNTIIEDGAKNNIYLTMTSQRKDLTEDLALGKLTSKVIFGKIPEGITDSETFYAMRDKRFERPGLASIESEGLRVNGILKDHNVLVQNYFVDSKRS